jgi:hypothetical protein
MLHVYDWNAFNVSLNQIWFPLKKHTKYFGQLDIFLKCINYRSERINLLVWLVKSYDDVINHNLF